MGVSSEMLRTIHHAGLRSQRVINNADEFSVDRLLPNGITNRTESRESTSSWDAPSSKSRSRSRSSRRTITAPGISGKIVTEQTDTSDNDSQNPTNEPISSRRSNAVYPLREIEAFTTVPVPVPKPRPRGRPPKNKHFFPQQQQLSQNSTPSVAGTSSTTPDETISESDLQYVTYVQDQLKAHMEKMRHEYKYDLIKSLRRARISIDKSSTEESKVTGYYDKESPFKNMTAITKLGSQLEEDADVSNFHTKLSIRHKERILGGFGDKELIYCPSIDVRTFKNLNPSAIDQSSRVTVVPKYHIYTTLANNITVDDDDVLRFQPYLGEEADEVNDPLLFEENYPLDITRHARENGQQREMVEWICDELPRLLNKFELLQKSLSYYLIGDLKRVPGINAKAMEKTRKRFFPPDHDPTYPKTRDELSQRRRNLGRPEDAGIDAAQLRKAELVCKALRDVMGVRAWWVLKALSNEGKHRALQPFTGRIEDFPAILPTDNEPEITTQEHKLAILSGGNPIPYQLDTYTKLHCPVCYMHQCPFHALPDSDSEDDEKPPPKEVGIYDGLNANTYPDEADVPCSDLCFLKDDVEHILEDQKLHPWSTAQKELLTQSLMILFDNQRAACMLASVINRPCVEIHKVIAERRKGTAKRVPRKQLEVQQARGRKRRTGFLRMKKKTDVFGYPRDCATNTQEALARPPHKGCDHEGACTKENGCSCVKNQVMCEKTCKCDVCIRKWRGCRCARRDIPCLPGSCECRKWNRECDADLCRTCGASEALDPVNRYNLELAKDCCGNIEAQRGLPKRTYIGLSNIQVAGLGLFIGEKVKKDQFIGEYLGEVISEPEAERRGVLYDKRGVSFLFNLNRDQVVDAARAGNKLRFINHYYEPNCIARVVLTGVIHRIGMYALRDLYPGEELYFDYGYNEKTSNFVQAEPEYKFNPPEPVKEPKKNTKTTLARKTKGLKNGKHVVGKKRMRAATKQTILPSSVVPQKRARGRPRIHPIQESSRPTSSRTSSRARRALDRSPISSGDEEEDSEGEDSDSSEGSVIEIRTADHLDSGSDDADGGESEEEVDEEEAALEADFGPLAVPDSEDDDDDYREDESDDEQESSSKDSREASVSSGAEAVSRLRQVPENQSRKRRRLHSPLSRAYSRRNRRV